MYWLITLVLLLPVAQSYGFSNRYNKQQTQDHYILGGIGESCTQSCINAGHKSCVSNMGDTDTVVDKLYTLHEEGDIGGRNTAAWSEEYHPIVEEDGTFVGWDVIPVTGGNCEAFPPDYTQRRLCRCSDTCKDTFRWCRALRVVCHKYRYTRNVCPMTCNMCIDLPDVNSMVP